MVCMRHLIFLFTRDLILIEGKMKSSSYGLVFILNIVSCRSRPRVSMISCKVDK